MADTVFVSTTAFGSDVDRAIAAARRFGIALEFGSAIPHRPSLETKYREFDAPRLPHNYFPAPAQSFVLNLASLDPALRERSLEHCTKGIKLASDSDAPFYAAHAGFCVDPDPEHLGEPWDLSKSYDLIEAYQMFCASVHVLADQADQKEVDFLLENNVVTPFNVNKEGDSPLLLTRPQEIGAFFQDIDHPHIGLLLDTGHLKVTARTFGFDVHDALRQIQPHVRGIHHSDNDGRLDTNSPIERDYWFLKYMADFKDVPHVLEVKNQSVPEIMRQIDLLAKQID